MPLDVLGRTRATLTEPTSSSPWPEGLGNLVKLCRAGDRALQLLLFNEEFLVSASHQLALITSLPFVHTARRYYRLNGSVRPSDWLRDGGNVDPTHKPGLMGSNDARTGMPPGIPGGAMCVQRFDDSRNSAIHITYRISLRSSSMPEPRDPLLKVLTYFLH